MNNKLINRKHNSIISQNSLASIKNMLISEVIEMYLMSFQSECTKKCYRYDLKTFLQFCEISYLNDFARYSPVQMTKLFFDFLNTIAKTEKYRKDHVLNPKTVNRKAYTISSFFNYLMSEFNYPFNPTKNFKQMEVPLKSTTESLSKKEIMQIINYTKAESEKGEAEFRNYLIILFLSSLALRRNELVNLKWSDIEKTSFIISVFQKGRTIKKLPLPIQIIEPLMQFKKEYKSKSEFIFRPTQNHKTKELDKPLSTDSVFKIVKDIIKEVFPKKDNITPHSFRKSFIEISLDARIDVSSIRNATGHHNLDALRYYDGRDEVLNNAVNLFFDINQG